MSGTAGADTIDFTTLTNGTSVSNQFDGVSFSLTGGPGPGGAPLASTLWAGTMELNNSTSGVYPSSAFLNLLFDTTASGINFTFNNYGTSLSGRGASSYSAYDTSGGLVSTGFLGTTNSYSIVNNVVGSGIKNLVFSNGTNGTDSWEFGLQQIGFTAAGGVPEPSTWH